MENSKVLVDDPSTRVLGSISAIDRLLPLWIVAAMAAGVGIGYYLPGSAGIINSMQVDAISLPIAAGLIWMMYPPLAAVNYRRIAGVRKAGRVLTLSTVLNWAVGPFLMFGLAWLLLPDLPGFRDGVILVGLARCIAMVLVWNMLAGGNNEYAALIVAMNALFQIAFYSVFAYLFINILPAYLGHAAGAASIHVDPATVAWSVAVFLGVPLAMGIITRYSLVSRKGERWYEERFLPRLKPTALLGLLFTLVMMFGLEGRQMVALPADLLRVAAPLLAYFLIMFTLSYLISWKMGFDYEETVTTSFTAASNNFELAIAVAVSIFGITSSQAFATVVGPLIEVPVMIGLVYVSLWLKGLLFGRGRGNAAAGTGSRGSGAEGDWRE